MATQKVSEDVIASLTAQWHINQEIEKEWENIEEADRDLQKEGLEGLKKFLGDRYDKSKYGPTGPGPIPSQGFNFLYSHSKDGKKCVDIFGTHFHSRASRFNQKSRTNEKSSTRRFLS